MAQRVQGFSELNQLKRMNLPPLRGPWVHAGQFRSAIEAGPPGHKLGEALARWLASLAMHRTPCHVVGPGPLHRIFDGSALILRTGSRLQGPCAVLRLKWSSAQMSRKAQSPDRRCERRATGESPPPRTWFSAPLASYPAASGPVALRALQW